MNCSRRRFPTFARIGIAVLIFGVVLFAAGCGKNGSIYGALDWDYALDWSSIGGFPPSGYSGVYYKVNEGSYNVYYTLYDSSSGIYYPGYYMGDPYNPSYYWSGTYTVTADKGSFLSDGKDSYFQLYLGYDGMYKYGDVRSMAAPGQDPTKASPRLGTRSWTQDGLLITVTNEIRKLTPEQLSKLQKSQFEKK